MEVRYIILSVIKTSAVVIQVSIGHCPVQSFVREPSHLCWLSLCNVLSVNSQGTRWLRHAHRIRKNALSARHSCLRVSLPLAFMFVGLRTFLIQFIRQNLTKEASFVVKGPAADATDSPQP
jgi:hypothetical protein